jgi:hypothetical protein
VTGGSGEGVLSTDLIKACSKVMKLFGDGSSSKDGS